MASAPQGGNRLVTAIRAFTSPRHDHHGAIPLDEVDLCLRQ
jgi:hypothetical protein